MQDCESLNCCLSVQSRMLYLCAIRRGLAVDASWQGCSRGFCRSPLPRMNLHMQRCVQLLIQTKASKQAFAPFDTFTCSSQRSRHDTLAAMQYKPVQAAGGLAHSCIAGRRVCHTLRHPHDCHGTAAGVECYLRQSLVCCFVSQHALQIQHPFQQQMIQRQHRCMAARTICTHKALHKCRKMHRTCPWAARCRTWLLI